MIMYREDIAMKKFYREERQAYLAERWAMADEERHMREVMRIEALKAMRTKYDVVGAESEEMSDKKLRRDEIKKMMADRQRAAREQKLMVAEDELGQQMRIDYKREVQRMLLEHEMSLLNADEDGEELDLAPLRNKELEKQRRKLREEERAHELATNQAFLDTIEAERDLLASEDRVNRYRVLARRKQHLALRADVYMKDRLSASLKAEREMSLAQAAVDETRERAALAIGRVEKLRPVVTKLHRDRIVVGRETDYMISDVMHDCNQRFMTDKLHADLHTHYFYLLCSQMGNGAEIVSLERRLHRVMDQLQTQAKAIGDKEGALRRLEERWRRANWMRLRRSELCKLIFGKARRGALLKALRGWSDVATWQVSTRRMFETKVGVQQHRAALAAVERRPGEPAVAHGGSNNQASPDKAAQRLTAESLRSGFQTAVRKHANRSVQCKHCKEKFTEQGNHSRACAFHPGVYAVACPKTCTRNSGRAGGAVDSRCAAHYRRRWSCCDQTKSVPFGKDGCRARWHIAVPVDKDYVEMVSRVEAAVRAREERGRQLDAVVESWKGRARSRNFDKLQRTREHLEREREIVGEYEDYMG